MKRYTAGHTDIFGVPHEVASANTYKELLHEITEKETNPSPNRSDVLEAIKTREHTSSPWVREANYRLVVRFFDPGLPDSQITRVEIKQCFNTLDKVAEYVIRVSEDWDGILFTERQNGVETLDFIIGRQICTLDVDSIDLHVPHPEHLTVQEINSFVKDHYRTKELSDSMSDYGIPPVAEVLPSTAASIADCRNMQESLEQKLRSLVRLAHEEGFPQTSLAQLAGVSQPTIGRWLKENTDSSTDSA